MTNLITDTAHTNSMSAETSRREILDDDVLACPGADLGFSRGGGRIFKKKLENFECLFLGRPNPSYKRLGGCET